MKQAAIPVLVLVAIVGLAILTTWPSTSLEANHYQRFQDGKSLYALLHSRIRAGDSLEVVENILGKSVPLVEGAAELRVQLRQEAERHPERCPHGVYDTDTFVTYPVENNNLLLQFRNGYLINHDPAMFEQFYPQQDIGGAPGPDSNSTEAVEIGGQL